MSYSDNGSSSSDLPDCPLVVKCVFDRALKRISFASAVNCTFDRLRSKIERSYSLSAFSFTISYKDDDGEVTAITNDFDLTEAIHYFHTGDDPPPSSGSSAYSGRSSDGRRITLRIQVTVDYDGPSLSDTASLASMEDYPKRGKRSPAYEFDAESLSGSFAAQELDDDAVTVSSRDVQGLSARPAVQSSSSSRELPITRPPYPYSGSSAVSSSDIYDSSRPPGSRGGGRSVRFDGEDDLGSIHLSESDANYSLVRGMEIPSGQRLGVSPARSPDLSSASTPTPVFEQLRLAEQAKSVASSGSYNPGFSHNERGVRWLQEQNARTMRTMIGEVAPSASSDASSVLREDYDGETESVIKGDLALQQGVHGRFYYTYTSDAVSQSGYRESLDSEVPLSALDRRISTSSQNLAWLNKHQAHSGPSKRVSRSPALPPTQDLPSINERPLPELPNEAHQVPINTADIPAELLPFVNDAFALPEKVTDCSSCCQALDTFRYVCATCGEKTSHPIDQVASPRTEEDPNDIKGKGKAVAVGEEGQSSEPINLLYPPTQSPEPPASPSNTSSSWGLFPDKEHSSFSFSSLWKGKNRGFKKLASKPSLRSDSDSQGSGPSVVSLSETAVSSQSRGYPTSPVSDRSRLRTSATFEEGFELCQNCIARDGVAHAYETALQSSSGSSTGSSVSLLSSPTSSPEETESSLRRSAPLQKGRARHAFIEKVWNGREWKEIEQDDKSTCSICEASLIPGRYKCVTCDQFNLCRGCYGQVHEIHPAHAFILVPHAHRAPSPEPPSRSDEEEVVAPDEQSLKHPGVSCYNCGLDILGARFHCAVCDSVDICQNCESAGLPGNLTTSTEGGHDSSHIMIKIPYPLDSTEVAFASRRARVLWSERDAATIDATTKRVTPRSRSNSVDSSYATTVIAPGRRRGSNPMDHMMRCNGCNRNIVGVRYQCANCPSYPVGYNLCYECEKTSFIIHPFPHVFLKLNRRVDRAIQAPDALLPILYEEPVDGSDFIDSMAANISGLVHESTLCDLCVQPIHGPWFHCVYCSSDMCDVHEATHNPDHCSIVFKSKVALNTLRTVIDIDDPNKNKALIHPVYGSSNA